MSSLDSKSNNIQIVVLITIFIIFTAVVAYSLRRTTTQLVPATIYLLWEPQAQFAGYYVAEDLGFFRDEGLQVTFRHSLGIGESLQQIKSEPNSFVVTLFVNYLEWLERGSDLVLLSIVNKGCNLGWISNQRYSQKQFVSELSTKRLYSWWGPHDLLLRAFLRSHGSKIVDLEQRVTTEYSPQLPDNMLALAMSYNEATEFKTSQNDKFLTTYCELNFPIFEDVLVSSHGDEQKSELSQKVVRAMWRGWDWAKKNPQRAVDIVMSKNPRRGRSDQEFMLKSFLLNLTTEGDDEQNIDFYLHAIRQISKSLNPDAVPRVEVLLDKMTKSTSLRNLSLGGGR